MAKNMYQKRKERKEKKAVDNNEIGANSTKINWYPGHMAKTKREIKEKLNIIDVVYEVVDSRIPFSSKIKDIDSIVRNKPRILIMTKKDLCDLTETNKYIKHYESLGYHVLFFDLIKDNPNTLLTKTNAILDNLTKSRENKGMLKRRFRALIIGIPNSGKSTLINKLSGKKVVNVGNKPGITKSLEWIRVNDEVEFLDTPGVLWAKLDDEEVALNLASTTAIKEEVLPIFKVAVHILTKLDTHYKNILQKLYKLDTIDYEDIVNTFDHIGKLRGCLVSGGEVDYDKVSLLIINDLKSNRISGITLDRFDK